MSEQRTKNTAGTVRLRHEVKSLNALCYLVNRLNVSRGCKTRTSIGWMKFQKCDKLVGIEVCHLLQKQAELHSNSSQIAV